GRALSLHVAIQGIPQVLCGVGCWEKMQAKAALTKQGLFFMYLTGPCLMLFEKALVKRHCCSSHVEIPT
ncbi:hypothetical protein GBF38_014375, partial [Nibea albiflora]